MKTVKVLYFASLRELIGHPETEISLETPISAMEIWVKLNPKIAFPDACLIAINQEYSSAESLVNPSDEVAFFPPVTGG